MKQERRKLITVLTLNFMCVRITKVKGNDSVSRVAVFFKRERFIG